MNRTSHGQKSAVTTWGKRKNKGDSLTEKRISHQGLKTWRILGEGGAKEVWLTAGCTFSSEPNRNLKDFYILALERSYVAICDKDEKMLDRRSFCLESEDQERLFKGCGPWAQILLIFLHLCHLKTSLTPQLQDPRAE